MQDGIVKKAGRKMMCGIIRIFPKSVTLLALFLFFASAASAVQGRDSADAPSAGESSSAASHGNWGFEINPLITLAFADEALWFTGGVQWFGLPGAEVSFPFQLIHNVRDDMVSLDAHCRWFRGRDREPGGIYFSGFARYAFFGGTGYNFNTGKEIYFEDHRLGAGAGIGCRIYVPQGFYWGLGLNLGRYLLFKDPDGYSTFRFLIGGMDPWIFDIEFFKFGYTF